MTNSQLGNVPAHFFRKATLKNSERFGTEELARIEGDMLEAREKSANLEYEIFMRIREEVGKYIQRLQALAQGIATVDVLQSLAVVAETQHLIRPEFGDDSQIDIRKGAMLSLKGYGGSDLYSKYDSDGRRYQYSTGYRAKHEWEVYLYASVSHDGGYGPAGFLCSC